MTVDALIEPAVLSEICEEIAALLKAEIAAGNVVAETSRDWPSRLNVFLAEPFRVSSVELPACVVRRVVNDPHYWLAEYDCTAHGHLLACKFGPSR